jgi:hypothetical protein
MGPHHRPARAELEEVDRQPECNDARIRHRLPGRLVVVELLVVVPTDAEDPCTGVLSERQLMLVFGAGAVVGVLVAAVDVELDV